MSSTGRLIDTAEKWFEVAIADADGDVVLTSPYLAFDVCRRIAEAAQSSQVSWTLVTTLDPSAVANGYLSVKGLRRMMESGVDIQHVERLHAKCFIVGHRAMLGSANLTGAGLGSSPTANRELGVELDQEQAASARATIASWSARTVDQGDLDQLLVRSKELTGTERTQRDRLDTVSALQLAEQLLEDARDPERSLWLKLKYGEPSMEGWRQESRFASPKKSRPGFRPGDLVFICSKKTRDCYAVVEVVSEPVFRPADYIEETDPASVERWPWVNYTKPRLVPAKLMELKLDELGVHGRGLQNGHVRLQFDQFTAGVRALARLATA
ncbi:phospholipase D family protein [Kocuria sp. cx-116]|uniref:phospholipase D family protein n=1 Tax=Kocuria sp. cx-116 TaxID=2771378 RepID=UPI0016872CEC|nr:phospholipase D family protein [Kocuria sp. cx-116]MBD2763526.1 phospholipase D family protein [Kocuria sp. cx-116]